MVLNVARVRGCAAQLAEAAGEVSKRAVAFLGNVLSAWGDEPEQGAPLSAVRRGAAELARDVHIYGGGVLVSMGLHAVYAPAGFVAFGALLIYIGLRRP